MQYFNRHIHQDLAAVLDASAALEVTEFRLFELAFYDWFGKKPEEPVIEKYFAAYMFANRIPHWVRSFARKILELDAKGELDPKSFGVWRKLPSARMMFFAKVYVAVLLIIFLILLVSTFNLPATILAPFRNCYFPPCY